jgi:DNA-binding GntR family transcriptional regulator
VTENSTRPLRVERNPAPVRTQVIDNLRQAIIDCRFLPGQRLIERELVELTGVSRTSIREALRELTAEGLVTSVPNKGNVVTRVSAKEAAQLYEVRSALEGLAGRIFVRNASAKSRYDLAEAMRDIERAASAGVSHCPCPCRGARRKASRSCVTSWRRWRRTTPTEPPTHARGTSRRQAVPRSRRSPRARPPRSCKARRYSGG